MNNIEHTLDMAANIKGAFAVAIVDYESGMTLGSRGGSAEFDLDVAAPGNSEVMRAKLDVMQKLGLRNETIEDILITLGSQYHLIRPVQGAAGREAVPVPGAQQGPGEPRDGAARPAGHRAGVLHGQPDGGSERSR